MVTKAIERAQRTVEDRNFEIRKDVLKYDEVMNEQRKVIYRRRSRSSTAAISATRPTTRSPRRSSATVLTNCPDEYPEDWISTSCICR